MLSDIQNTKDQRNIHIQRVGVKKVHLPLRIKEKGGGYQRVLGEVSLSADLSADFRGTHMSRFMETLNRWSKENISSKELEIILQEILKALNANRGEISLKFKYFIEKEAPVSGLKGMLDYSCEFFGMFIEGEFYFILGIQVPITTVCPCSKEISQYGAHNQRAVVSLKVEYQRDSFIWIEDLVELVEKTGSFGLFPVIKRVDEKYITEKAFENPKFVEDVVRDIAEALQNNPRVLWFEAECEAAESIHNHNAFACLQGGTYDRRKR